MSKYKGVKTLEVLEGADNYNEWIASAIRPYIKSPALEVGAGMGNLSEYFVGLGELVLSDIDESLVKILKKRFKKRKNVHAEVLDVSKKFAKVKNKFSTIFAINVLEHIKDDEDALVNMNKLLERGGNIVLLVPAKKFAFSDLDKNLGHYRRYEKKELASKVRKAGFKVEHLAFFNIIGLLSWIIRDKITNEHSQLKRSHVKIFDTVVPLLKLLEPKKRLPIGISLIIVASKK